MRKLFFSHSWFRRIQSQFIVYTLSFEWNNDFIYILLEHFPFQLEIFIFFDFSFLLIFETYVIRMSSMSNDSYIKRPQIYDFEPNAGAHNEIY